MREFQVGDIVQVIPEKVMGNGNYEPLCQYRVEKVENQEEIKNVGGNKMLKLQVKTTSLCGRIQNIMFSMDGSNWHDTMGEAFQYYFSDQGDLYEQVFGVDRDTANDADWHPEDGEFDASCDGWSTFLSDKGVAKKEEIEEVDVNLAVFKY